MGFIGAEVAASLRMLGNDVTVVEIFETTLYRILGPTIGRVLESVHRDHGMKMLFNEAVASYNHAVAQFPTVMIVGLFGFRSAGTL